MRIGSTLAAAGIAVGLAVGSAQAATMVTLQPAIDTGPAPQVELVRGGCGWGAHRTWHGYCHLNFGWRGRSRFWRRGWY